MGGIGVEALRRYIDDLDRANVLSKAVEVIAPADSKVAGKNALHIMAFRLSGFCREQKVGTDVALSYAEGFDLLARSASREALNLQGPHYGYAPLHQAAASGNVAAVEALLKAGAVANVATTAARDEQPRTPLDLACKNNCSVIAPILRNYGARNLTRPPSRPERGRGSAPASSQELGEGGAWTNWRPSQGAKRDHKGNEKGKGPRAWVWRSAGYYPEW